MKPSNYICSHCFTVNKLAITRLNLQIEMPSCKKCKQPIYQGEALSLNDLNFSEVINSTDLPLVVDFWSVGCAPCKAMLPAYTKASQELFPDVILAKLNIEISPQTTEKYDIRGLPTFLSFRDGQSFDRKIGAMTTEQIIEWVKSVT